MEEARRPTAASMGDRELVIAFKDGARWAYDEIYRRHSPKVRVVCARRLGQSQDTEEAVQETFLRAFQALPRFNGEYRLGAWLNRIAINVCIDEIRARSRSEVVSLGIEGEPRESDAGPDEILASRRPEVFEALGAMKPLHARALALQAFDGLSYEELATRLAMTPSQVKSLLHRARSSFKRVLRDVSGWLVAPFLTLKRSRRDQALHAGASANAMGVFAAVHVSLPAAEKIVTTAVLAALSFGAATAPAQPTAKERRMSAKTVPVQRDDARTVERDLLAAPSVRVADAKLNVADELPIEVPDTAVVDETVETVERIVERSVEHVERELKEHTKESDKDGTVHKPAAAHVEAARDEVDRTADEAEAAASKAVSQLAQP